MSPSITISLNKHSLLVNSSIPHTVYEYIPTSFSLSKRPFCDDIII